MASVNPGAEGGLSTVQGEVCNARCLSSVLLETSAAPILSRHHYPHSRPDFEVSEFVIWLLDHLALVKPVGERGSV